jgi:hypothetical protein
MTFIGHFMRSFQAFTVARIETGHRSTTIMPLIPIQNGGLDEKTARSIENSLQA